MPIDLVSKPQDNMSVPCLLCKKKSNFLFKKSDDQYYGCECGFVFIAPRPSEYQLREIYLRQGLEYWTTERMVRFAFSSTKSTREISFVRRFTSRGTLLDIGCS